MKESYSIWYTMPQQDMKLVPTRTIIIYEREKEIINFYLAYELWAYVLQNDEWISCPNLIRSG